MERCVELRVEDGLATLRLRRSHGNAINGALVFELARACQRLEDDDGVRGVLFAASGKLFCPGLDLQELVELDRPAMERFVREFNACVLALYALSKPVLAAIHGHAIAGGCVLALTADRRILARGALIGLNEVRVGVPLPFGVAQVLRDSVPRTHLEEVALLGNNYRDEQAVRAGLAHELHAAEGFEPHCRDRLEELASRDLNALRTTKRYLRAATVERMRTAEGRHATEFLDGWFRPATRERILEVVAGLQARRGN